MRICTIEEAPDGAKLLVKQFTVAQGEFIDCVRPDAVRLMREKQGTFAFSADAKDGPTLAQLRREAERYADQHARSILLFACHIGANEAYIGIASLSELTASIVKKNLH